MEGLAQRIRGLACDLRSSEPLGEKRRIAGGVSAFTANGHHPNKNVVSLDSTCIKVHPDGMGALKKVGSNPLGEHEADGIPNFIWSPHLTGMG